MGGGDGMTLVALSMRAFGFFLSLPFGDALNTLPRFFLSVGLAFLTASTLTEGVEVSTPSLIVEFAVGFLLGAPLRFIVDVSESVGELIDTARGQTISAIIDPLHGQGASDLAVLARSGATFFALSSGALEISVRGFARAARALPPGGVLLNENLILGVCRSGIAIVTEGLVIASVWLGAFLLVDCVCAFASKLLSGLSFTQAGGLLKMAITFLFGTFLLQEGAYGGIAWVSHAFEGALSWSGGAPYPPRSGG